MGAQGRVIALEPTLITFDLLVRALAINGLAIVSRRNVWHVGRARNVVRFMWQPCSGTVPLTHARVFGARSIAD